MLFVTNPRLQSDPPRTRPRRCGNLRICGHGQCPEATNSSTIRVSFGGENPQSVRARAAGRDFDGVKSTLTEVEGKPSIAWRFRHDERRYAGSAFNIKNHGENHASALN